MKPELIILPIALRESHRVDTSVHLMGIGNAALLETPLLGLLASRECPGKVLLDTLEQVPQWVQAGRVIVSGFHSPLEQQVLRSLLRRKGCAVKVLAHGMQSYRPEPGECEPLAAGQLLVITACPPTVTRTTRATALQRNRLVLALADEYHVPYIAQGSPLHHFVPQSIRDVIWQRRKNSS